MPNEITQRAIQAIYATLMGLNATASLSPVIKALRDGSAASDNYRTSLRNPKDLRVDDFDTPFFR